MSGKDAADIRTSEAPAFQDLLHGESDLLGSRLLHGGIKQEILASSTGEGQFTILVDGELGKAQRLHAEIKNQDFFWFCHEW